MEFREKDAQGKESKADEKLIRGSISRVNGIVLNVERGGEAKEG